MKRITCFLVFSSLIITSSKAQGLWKLLVGHPDSVVQKYDTTYIDPMLNQFTMRYFLNVKQAELNFRPENSKFRARYKAGDFMRFGVGVGYRWLIMNYSFGVDPARAGRDGDKSIRHNDLQMNIFGRRWLYDIRAQWYRGFNYEGVRRPDMSLVAFGTSLRYNFKHHKYSFKNTYDQTQWQLKSAGAPIVGINMGYLKVSTDSSVIIQDAEALPNIFHENFNIAGGGGYSFTWVIKKHWFITLTSTLYADVYFVGSKKNFEEDPGINLVLVPEFRGGFGYNSKKHYVGIQSTVHKLPGSFSDDLNYEYRYNNLKLLYCYRFDFNPFKQAKDNDDQ